jgi:hypothetical protein
MSLQKLVYPVQRDIVYLCHRLYVELDLQSLFGLHVLYSLAETPQATTHSSPSRRIWAHIRGRYWSAQIDDISLLTLAPAQHLPFTMPLCSHCSVLLSY